jgi:hypothetical protein
MQDRVEPGSEIVGPAVGALPAELGDARLDLGDSGERSRSGASPGASGADISSRPKEGTFDRRRQSSNPITTAWGLPWRVMIEGSPRTASSTTADRAALASRSWISRMGTAEMTTVVIYSAGIARQASWQCC